MTAAMWVLFAVGGLVGYLVGRTRAEFGAWAEDVRRAWHRPHTTYRKRSRR